MRVFIFIYIYVYMSAGVFVHVLMQAFDVIILKTNSSEFFPTDFFKELQHYNNLFITCCYSIKSQA